MQLGLVMLIHNMNDNKYCYDEDDGLWRLSAVAYHACCSSKSFYNFPVVPVVNIRYRGKKCSDYVRLLTLYVQDSHVGRLATGATYIKQQNFVEKKTDHVPVKITFAGYFFTIYKSAFKFQSGVIYYRVC